jgi:hypothetical protein
MTFEVHDLRDAGPMVLTRLRELTGYDLVVVGLPGAKSSDAWSMVPNSPDRRSALPARSVELRRL